ncbi:pentapeptide repeat-containing protein [Rufibacter ruber]|nr:pentapeptide repeat-containing protein [Rufibacter ruber]
MKKHILFLFAVLVLPAWAWAQKTVPASEVLARINRGEAVSYSGVTISGKLDLTQLQNKTLKPRRDVAADQDSKEYVSTVTAPLSFSNCTFTGDVLAYFNPDNVDGVDDLKKLVNRNSKNEVYNTHFAQDVKFENCTFEQQSAFKYSEFRGAASFAGSSFKEEAVFKYSKFRGGVSFSQARFKEDANFKYVKFPEGVNFNGATFEEEANFKYAHFTEGADFRKATFAGLANFKYAHLSDPMKVSGAQFTGSQDLKYAKLNQKSFSAAALKEMAK